jgi:mono/diheme cytochrome c family protein
VLSLHPIEQLSKGGKDMTKSMKKTLGATALFFGLTTVSVAFPWDIDMVDALFVRGYEAPMAELNDDVVTSKYRPNGWEHLEEGRYAEDLKTTGGALIFSEGNNSSVVSPFSDPKAKYVQDMGKTAFVTYCQTCHGVKGTVKKADGETNWGVSDGWNSPINALNMIVNGKIIKSGLAAYSDKQLYILIRNGKGRMPSYGHAMSDEEIWSAIHYATSLDGTSFNE